MRPAADETLTLLPGATCAVIAGRFLTVACDSREDTFPLAGESAGDALTSLAGALGTHKPVRCADHPGCSPVLECLRTSGWTVVTVFANDRVAYELRPLRPPDRTEPAGTASPGARWSTFAILRRAESGMVAESPLAWCELRLHDHELLAAIGKLAIFGDVCHGQPDLWPRLLHDMRWAGLVCDAPESETEDFSRRQWKPHELWFHYRSRLGGGTPPDSFGATLWAARRYDPLPARPAPRPGQRTALYRPDLAALLATDPPLTAVLESRTSVRTGGDTAPVTSRQLGEFLFRCARNQRQWTRNGMDLLSRPYPAGGSIHELEVYLVVRHAAGIESGVYHYDAENHELEHISPLETAATRLLWQAARAAGVKDHPQVLVCLTARVGRVMWKYESMAYALVLKNVGVLYQTMYLVATAMGLGSCALGAGHVSTLASIAGFDPVTECPVGEFMLGSPPSTAV